MAKKAKPKKTKEPELDPVLSPDLQEEIIRFMENHPPKRVSKNLRSMLMEFLMKDGAVESEYFNDLLYDLEGLFEMLDMMEGEEI